MQLGVVMMGTGVYAAASVGVVQALMERGIEPYAVCGMQAGAWPAALLLSGRDAQGLSRAVVQAAAARGRLLRISLLPGLCLTGGRRALGSGRGVRPECAACELYDHKLCEGGCKSFKSVGQ